MRFKLVVEYDGTAYHGWQIQPHGPTIQGALETALARIIGVPIRVEASGRTDAGVHASGQVVAFRTHREIPPARLLNALNALTPPDISVRSLVEVAEDFDPRRNATSREYVYRIWNASVPSPFWRRYAWFLRRRIDVDVMNRAAAVLLGQHDFTSFRAAGCDSDSPVRLVYQSEFERRAEMIVYRVKATAFLRHMVRNFVGTLVQVGFRERDPEDIRILLERRDRTQAGPTAPAHGLCLAAVNYSATDGSVDPPDVLAPSGG